MLSRDSLRNARKFLKKVYSSLNLSVGKKPRGGSARSCLLRHFRARHRLPTADGRQRRAQRLRGENADALLLHGQSHLLSVRLERGLAQAALLGGDLLQGGLKDM